MALSPKETWIIVDYILGSLYLIFGFASVLLLLNEEIKYNKYKITVRKQIFLMLLLTSAVGASDWLIKANRFDLYQIHRILEALTPAFFFITFLLLVMFWAIVSFKIEGYSMSRTKKRWYLSVVWGTFFVVSLITTVLSVVHIAIPESFTAEIFQVTLLVDRFVLSGFLIGQYIYFFRKLKATTDAVKEHRIERNSKSNRIRWIGFITIVCVISFLVANIVGFSASILLFFDAPISVIALSPLIFLFSVFVPVGAMLVFLGPHPDVKLLPISNASQSSHSKNNQVNRSYEMNSTNKNHINDYKDHNNNNNNINIVNDDNI